MEVFELNFAIYIFFGSRISESVFVIVAAASVCVACQSVSQSVRQSDSQFTNAHLGAMFIIRMHFSMKDCLWHGSSLQHMEVE